MTPHYHHLMKCQSKHTVYTCKVESLLVAIATGDIVVAIDEFGCEPFSLCLHFSIELTDGLDDIPVAITTFDTDDQRRQC